MRLPPFSLLFTACAVLGVTPAQALAASPSFDCNKAVRLDEFAICASDELSQLDRIQSLGYTFVKSKLGKSAALVVARSLQKDRKACGADEACIRRAMQVAILSYRIAGAPVDLPAVNTAASSGDSAANDGRCKIEDWNYAEKASSIYINGRMTCASGKLVYSLYDGDTGQFIASDFAFIEAYTFRSYTDGRVPDKLRIKYAVE